MDTIISTEAQYASYNNTEYRLTKDLVFVLDDRNIICVPHGFIFSFPFNSIPSEPVPYILREWLFDCEGLISPFKRLTASESNMLFKESCERFKFSKVEKSVMLLYYKVISFIR